MNSDLEKLQPEPAADGWKVLAGLRFYLASIVVCGHLFRFVPDDRFLNRALGNLGALDAVAAVFGFLVISGFSIAHSIKKSPVGFYQRRVLRIYPLYVCGVLASLVPFWFVGPRIATIDSVFTRPEPSLLAGNFVFLQGFVCGPLSANRPLWTLAVEVFCYLLAPLFMRLRTGLLLALIGISGSAYAVFPWLNLNFYSALLYGLPTFFLLWAWLSGFVFYRHRREPVFQIGLIGIGTLLFSVNVIFNTSFGIFTYVSSSLLVVFCDRLRLPAAVLRALNYLGELSYPLYVLHLPILIFAYAVLGVRSAPVMVALALLGAALFYHAIDWPLRRRNRARRPTIITPTGEYSATDPLEPARRPQANIAE
jgi:peptidoglycan/LPS O-acetylase OafA/YrhL